MRVYPVSPAVNKVETDQAGVRSGIERSTERASTIFAVLMYPFNKEFCTDLLYPMKTVECF